MPMDEDAMFKALLKNKPQPKQPATREIKDEPARPPLRPPATAAKGSEDAMFKALLHNKSPAQVPRQQAKVEPVQTAPPVARVQQEPVVITQVSPPPVIKFEPVVDSINNLTASVNQIHSLMKTIVVPVIILILLVGIGILIKTT
ncbi:MAG: hypothetical protein Q7J35_02335 [Candidatus Methanoperedens sp.]|nr:hypothetical protein [Candidatus Methanoperedens sp.]